MLSYMVPSEEKPPPGPLDLPLSNGHPPKRIIKTVSKSSAMSAESSASSLSSVVQDGVAATHEKPKHKHINNGQAKHPTLKRVSFGSSKGSMVETLIYESPLQEEPEPSPPASLDSSQGSESGKAAKVRVTFFECERPQTLSSPEPGDEALDAPFAMSQAESPAYQRQASTDSGWDNPFRPDGDLSREADEIVELIKGGKPITPTAANGEAPKLPDTTLENGTATKQQQQQQNKEPVNPSPNKSVNGKANGGPEKAAQLDVQRATLSPSDASQVERVKLNKKPKCKCCVIQ